MCQAICKTQQMLKAYQEALNKIDDYFEYSNESEKDKKKVRKVLSELTEELRKI